MFIEFHDGWWNYRHEFHDDVLQLLIRGMIQQVWLL